MKNLRSFFLVPPFLLGMVSVLPAAWQVNRPHDQRQNRPPSKLSEPKEIKPGDAWPNDEKFRWLRGDIEIPEMIEGKPAGGRAVGMRFSCGDGGEVWMDGKVQTRFDNDHPSLVLLTPNAAPGARVQVDVQVYGKVQGGDRFGEAKLVLIDAARATGTLSVSVDAAQPAGPVPNGLIGLSQGGGMADYDDSTAAILKEGGFKWFRMDNVFTPVLKKDGKGGITYDWKDFDRRIDFISKIGAEAILAASYMPQVLDAVPDNERHSAPRDYGAWEELCYQAAKRCMDRGKRVAFWEVWNEANSGWIKPGPEDTGSDVFEKIYNEAIGKEERNHEIVRRFEAYCKTYGATARGVRRADPAARVGGPALASGPFEQSERGHCNHGRGFARGLMAWCHQEKLPLDFVSWHEYLQGADVFIAEAAEFRNGLKGFPELERTVQSFMVTEWNEAWWADRPQDHEVGAAWAANTVTRAFIPHRIDRPCFFYVKQGDQNFRGDYAMLLKDNTPKAAYNMCKVFNSLSGQWLKVSGADGEVSCVAAWDAAKKRLAVVMVNFADRYGLARNVKLTVPKLPTDLAGATWREWTIDATHSNAWNDMKTAVLTKTRSEPVSGDSLTWSAVLPANSVTVVEVTP
ncbi:MAG TPA: hypothetical protein VG796_19310 [Verrucomicrobiales bacterium]|nr:hypothetical protein [Verrucomicrobiales bacterium]